MASIQSQIKRNRQNDKRRLRNRDYRGAARTAVKGARASLTGSEDAVASVMAAISALDRAAQKGAIHRRNAARRKGRLMKHLGALQTTGHPGQHAAPMSAERGQASAEQITGQKSKAKAEKGVKPVAPGKPKAETTKSTAKTAAKKTTEKKPAPTKSSKK